MLPITRYGKQAVKKPGKGPGEKIPVRDMNDMDRPEVLDREKTLLLELIACLEQEIEYVISGDVDTLEESMPQKRKILEAIVDNRAVEKVMRTTGQGGDDNKVVKLRQELGLLWKRVNGLNETSKDMVNRRLSDIEHRLEPFFSRLHKGYDKSGKASKSVAHTIKNGV